MSFPLGIVDTVQIPVQRLRMEDVSPDGVFLPEPHHGGFINMSSTYLAPQGCALRFAAARYNFFRNYTYLALRSAILVEAVEAS